MVYTKKDEIKRKFYQGAVMSTIIAAPFTGGTSLILGAAIAILGRKYNYYLQTEKEGAEMRAYHLVQKNYEEMETLNNLKESSEAIYKTMQSISQNELDHLKEIQARVVQKKLFGYEFGNKNLEVIVKSD